MAATMLFLAEADAPLPLAVALTACSAALRPEVLAALGDPDATEIGTPWVDEAVKHHGVEYHAVAAAMALTLATGRKRGISLVAPRGRAVADTLGWTAIGAPFSYPDKRRLSIVMRAELDRLARTDGHWSRLVLETAERLRAASPPSPGGGLRGVSAPRS
jgi:hypothetical protein